MDMRHKIKRRDGFRCLACGTTRNLTIDHVLPRCMGGSDEPENLQTLCGRCNQAKADTFIDFISMSRADKLAWVASIQQPVLV